MRQALMAVVALAVAVLVLVAPVRGGEPQGLAARVVPGTRVSVDVDGSFQRVEGTERVLASIEQWVSVQVMELEGAYSDAIFTPSFFASAGTQAGAPEAQRFGGHAGLLVKVRRTITNGVDTVSGYAACFGNDTTIVMVEVLGSDKKCRLGDADLRRMALSSRLDSSLPRPVRIQRSERAEPDRSMPVMAGTRIRAFVHGFEAARDGCVENPEAMLAVCAEELPIPYPEVEPLVRPGVWRQRWDVIIDSAEPYEFVRLSEAGDGYTRGWLAEVHSLNGRGRGYLAVLGTETHCSVVLVMGPEGAPRSTMRLARSIAAGVQLDTGVVGAAAADGGAFDITPAPPLTLQAQTPRAAMLTAGGSTPGARSWFIAERGSPLDAKVYPRGRQGYAERVFTGAGALIGQRIEQVRPVTIGGLEGFEITGTGTVRGSGAAARVYLVVLFAEHPVTYAIIGVQELGGGERPMMEAFRKTAATFRVREERRASAEGGR